MQEAWNKLNKTYAIPGLGYLALHPKNLHMENIHAKDDLLNINMGITATPVITFENPKIAEALYQILLQLAIKMVSISF
jgi:hypothetical protein